MFNPKNIHSKYKEFIFVHNTVPFKTEGRIKKKSRQRMLNFTHL